jgi:hypothetical protein
MNKVKERTKYNTQLGIVFTHKINPNDGEEYLLDLNDPMTKNKIIRWEMKLTDKGIHKTYMNEQTNIQKV